MPPGVGPEVAGSEADQDLYVFTVKRVTLKKGERMVMPVAEYELGYRDVYVLDLPFAPPMEVRANANDAQQQQLARLLGAPHFVHVLRLTNSAHEPLTTAPALISSGDRVLGQGMMSYTAPGADCDLGLTTAVDIKVAKSDKESGRVPNALTVDGSNYLRVDLNGSIAITNRRDQAVDIEVKRSVLGHSETAGQAGKAEMVNAYEEGGAVAQPPWWGQWEKGGAGASRVHVTPELVDVPAGPRPEAAGTIVRRRDHRRVPAAGRHRGTVAQALDVALADGTRRRAGGEADSQPSCLRSVPAGGGSSRDERLRAGRCTPSSGIRLPAGRGARHGLRARVGSARPHTGRAVLRRRPAPKRG